MIKKIEPFFIILLFSVSLPSCIITYRDFPEQMIGNKPQSKDFTQLYYQIHREPILDGGGYRRLVSVFKEESPFATTVKTEKIPQKGLFCHIDIQWKVVGGPSAFFGYLSVGTLGIFPAWSTKDGYRLTYTVYVNGKEGGKFVYEITRKAGVWLGLIPFSWINFFTYDQGEAFEATAYQFFKDAQPIFSKAM